MLEIRQLIGKVDSVTIDPELLTGDPIVDNQSAFLISVKAGGLCAVDENGYATVADGASDTAIGVFTNDGVSNPLDNAPNVASGLLGVLIGGGLLATDQVAGVIAAGTLLYAGTGTEKGLFTSTIPVEGAVAVGISRSKNSTTNKTLLVQAF
jgi:hypothetical protein